MKVCGHGKKLILTKNVKCKADCHLASELYSYGMTVLYTPYYTPIIETILPTVRMAKWSYI